MEYVVLLRSRNECKDVIGYIKTNASVFLNMEFIASDSERQRCVDMLSGAAYTLGCALNKISPRGIYLISAPTVKVVLDPAMQKAAAAPEAQGYARQRYEQEGYSAGYTQAQQPQRPAADYQQQSAGHYQQAPSLSAVSASAACLRSPGSPAARAQNLQHRIPHGPVLCAGDAAESSHQHGICRCGQLHGQLRRHRAPPDRPPAATGR